MTDPDYRALLDDAFGKLTELQRQRSDLDVEVAKLTQFIHAIANMVPDNERAEVFQKLEIFVALHQTREATLTDAVRKVLQEAGRVWLTVAQVRNRLFAFGFDFRAYISNPLASVSTTLSRLKKEEVETTTIEGVAAYRWRKQSPRRKK